MDDNHITIEGKNPAETLGGHNQMLMDMLTGLNTVGKCGYVITEYQMTCTVKKVDGNPDDQSIVKLDGEVIDFTGGATKPKKETAIEGFIHYLDIWAVEPINGGYPEDQFRVFLENCGKWLVDIFGVPIVNRIMGGYNQTYESIMKFHISSLYVYFNDIFLLMGIPYSIVHTPKDLYVLVKKDQ